MEARIENQKGNILGTAFCIHTKKTFQNTVRFWTPKRVSMNRHKRLRDGSWTRVLDAKSGPEKKPKNT